MLDWLCDIVDSGVTHLTGQFHVCTVSIDHKQLHERCLLPLLVACQQVQPLKGFLAFLNSTCVQRLGAMVCLMTPSISLATGPEGVVAALAQINVLAMLCTGEDLFPSQHIPKK